MKGRFSASLQPTVCQMRGASICYAPFPPPPKWYLSAFSFPRRNQTWCIPKAKVTLCGTRFWGKGNVLNASGKKIKFCKHFRSKLGIFETLLTYIHHVQLNISSNKLLVMTSRHSSADVFSIWFCSNWRTLTYMPGDKHLLPNSYIVKVEPALSWLNALAICDINLPSYWYLDIPLSTLSHQKITERLQFTTPFQATESAKCVYLPTEQKCGGLQSVFTTHWIVPGFNRRCAHSLPNVAY